MALSILLALNAGCSKTKTQGRAYPKAPVILVSIDTLRADRLPIHGYTKVETPALDAFARESWVFTNAYSPVPLTLPAHASLLSGSLPPEHGVRNNAGFFFDGKVVGNMPAHLKKNGYVTGAAVSSYVLRYETGLGALFDFYDDSISTTRGGESARNQRSGQETAARAVQWLSKEAEKPLFFLFHIYEPHAPYVPPEPFLSRYGATYDGEVAASDAVVGGFLHELKKLGIYDRAVVIVLSDHGEGLGDHGEDQHGILLYREAIHVPLLVKLPKGEGGGQRVETPVELPDIFPTVAKLLGLAVPQGVSGRSLFDPPSAGEGERMIFAETLYPRLQLGWSDLKSVTSRRYQFIHGPRPELYDIVEDPLQKMDLMPKKHEAAADLARALHRYPHGNAKPASVDEETMKRLASLGYIGSMKDPSSAADLPNPVDNVKYLKLLEEGWRLAANHENAKAAATFRELVAQNPGMFDAWVQLGVLYAEMGRDDDAAAAYRRALAVSPVFLPDLATELGLIEVRRKQFDEAEKLARRALDGVPAKARELLARIALARGDLPAAEKEARAAAESRNPQPSTVLVMAEIQSKAGRLEDSLASIAEARRLADALHLGAVYQLEFLRGDALARLNRLDEAEAAFLEEVKGFPLHAQAHASLAVVRFLKGDRAGAERRLEEMVRLNPSPAAYSIGIQTLSSLGFPEKAAAWRKKAGTSRNGGS
ncbi:MAG: sulfatase-like hydrolase/transferase [Acidobacteria bacterium]|nr:sulfatase-like hydrolase/transferase [Acidobacteriota bacterium]